MPLHITPSGKVILKNKDNETVYTVQHGSAKMFKYSRPSKNDETKKLVSYQLKGTKAETQKPFSLFVSQKEVEDLAKALGTSVPTRVTKPKPKDPSKPKAKKAPKLGLTNRQRSAVCNTIAANCRDQLKVVAVKRSAKKKSNEPSAELVADVVEKVIRSAEKAAEKAAEQTVKKGRGRPKKEVKAAAEEAAEKAVAKVAKKAAKKAAAKKKE